MLRLQFLEGSCLCLELLNCGKELGDVVLKMADLSILGAHDTIRVTLGVIELAAKVLNFKSQLLAELLQLVVLGNKLSTLLFKGAALVCDSRLKVLKFRLLLVELLDKLLSNLLVVGLKGSNLSILLSFFFGVNTMS